MFCDGSDMRGLHKASMHIPEIVKEIQHLTNMITSINITFKMFTANLFTFLIKNSQKQLPSKMLQFVSRLCKKCLHSRLSEIYTLYVKSDSVDLVTKLQ